jgi:GGDEF domain-containing protein
MTLVVGAGLAAFAVLLLVALTVLLRRYVEERVQELAAARVSSALTAVNARIQAESRAIDRGAALPAAAADPFSGVSDLDDALEVTLELAAALPGVDAASIWLEGLEDMPVVATLGLSPEEASRQALARPPEGRNARSIIVSFRHPTSAIRGRGLESGVGVPLPVQQDGSLYVFTRSSDRRFGEDDIRALELIAARAAPAIEATQRLRQLQQLADIDPSTGLGTRRSFEQNLGREIDRARRYRRRLALVVLELDGAGADPVLAGVGVRLRSTVRSTDVPYRIGVGELALILPESSRGGAELLYRRLIRDLPELKRNGEPARAGLAELTGEDNEGSFLRRALAGAEAG